MPPGKCRITIQAPYGPSLGLHLLKKGPSLLAISTGQGAASLEGVYAWGFVIPGYAARKNQDRRRGCNVSMAPRIRVDQAKLRAFCRKHHIRRLAFFGSVLRADFGPTSDVDVLVEFEPEHVRGLEFFEMEQELGRLIGRSVDLNTPSFLSPYFRQQVEREAEVAYGEA